MSRVLNLNITILNINNGQWAMLSLTTYLNMILLFMAYCDSEKVFSRVRIVRCLALVDFLGAVLSQVIPNCILSRYFNGCSNMLPCEVCFLVFERLAFNINTNFLKLTQTTLCDTFRGNVLTQTSFRDTFQNTVFYHGLTLLLSLVLVTLFFPNSIEMPLVFHSVIKNTLLRGVFFTLDGMVIYGVHVLARKDEEKRGMIWQV